MSYQHSHSPKRLPTKRWGRRTNHRPKRRSQRATPRTLEHMHDAATKAAMLLTSEGADVMAEVRASCDALELLVADDMWPLPKYREMLFPV